MTTVLAVDTASEICSVAFLSDNRRVERSEAVGNAHSDRILPMIDEVLAEADTRLDAVDVIAFGAGPGSFTGLRIACGVVQGLAWAAGKRVVAIGNLRALAAGAFSLQPEAEVVLAAIDARMGEAYCGIYRRGQRVDEVRGPSLEDPRSLDRLAEEFGATVFAGNALIAFPDIVSHQSGILLPRLAATAADIALLGRADAAAGLTTAPEHALPVYVRDQVAMTIDERQKRRNPPASVLP
jgi:tRNA threonylcarbamoyladenosine biosynthesis protein TsaB